MLRSRVIPCLLIQNGGLVKTVGFKQPKYVGDPLNAVRIFNEKAADELMVLDIDASALGRPPDYNLIGKLAAECQMPLCYGGGVKAVSDAERIIEMGVEKIAISSAVITSPHLIKDMATAFGRQSVVAVLDVKKKTSFFGTDYEVYTNNGTTKHDVKLPVMIEKITRLGVGEIVINSIDDDGSMKGYDYNLVDKIRHMVDVPLTILGGAGSLDDLKYLISEFGIIGAAAGSLFVFKGKYKAVLINYPTHLQKIEICENSKKQEGGVDCV